MDEILENQHIRIVFDLTQGIHLSEIVNKKTGQKFIVRDGKFVPFGGR